LVVLAAGKGAPGVSTAAVALAAVWPRPAVLAEADPAGGDLVFRLTGANGHPLAQDRGLLSLATAVRSGPGLAMSEHVQSAAGGLPVLVGPASPVQAAGIAASWPALAAALAGTSEADVLVDCGRLGPDTPLPVLARADLVLLLVRPTLAGVAHLRAALGWLLPRLEPTPPPADRLGVVVRADPRHGESASREVRDVLAGSAHPVAVLGSLVEDPAGAAGLAGQWTRALDRAPLVASARTLAGALDRRLAAGRGRPAPPAPAPALAPPSPAGASDADSANAGQPATTGGR
jgi:hypothetical protein